MSSLEIDPYFIVLRFVRTGHIAFVTKDESDQPATFPSMDAAQTWIDNSPLIQCGQVVADFYEVP